MLLGSDGRDFFEDSVDRSHGHDQRGLGKIDCLIYDEIDKLINYNSSCWQNGFHALMIKHHSNIPNGSFAFMALSATRGSDSPSSLTSLTLNRYS